MENSIVDESWDELNRRHDIINLEWNTHRFLRDKKNQFFVMVWSYNEEEKQYELIISKVANERILEGFEFITLSESDYILTNYESEDDRFLFLLTINDKINLSIIKQEKRSLKVKVFKPE